MLIARGQSVIRTPQNNSASSLFSPGNEHNSASDLANLVELLSELGDLLEDYSPVWYTQEHQRRLKSALRASL